MTEMNPKQYHAYAMRTVAQVPGIDPQMPGRDIKKVAVIGAGLMGSGIAVCFLRAGIPTILVDTSKEALERGRKSIASPAEVDKAMVNYGFPMGPCAMGDMAGVDVRNYVLDAMKSDQLIPDDPRYGAMSKALFAEGRLGQKTAAGNYDYGEDGRTPIPSDKVSGIRDRIAAELGVRQRDISEEEIVNRCLLAVINEAAEVVGEGIVNHPSDVDILWMYGYGFPGAKCGPVYQAREMGLEQVRATMNAYKDADEKFGEIYWSPSASLDKLFV